MIKILDLLNQSKVLSYKQYRNGKITLYSRIYRVWPHNHILYNSLGYVDKLGFVTGFLLSDGYIYKDGIHATIYQALTLRKFYMLPMIKEVVHVLSNMVFELGGRYSLTARLKNVRNPSTKKSRRLLYLS